MRTVRSRVTRGIGRIEEPGRLEPAPVVGDRLVVGVRPLGVPSGAADQLDRLRGVAERERQAGVAGALGQHAVVVGRCRQRGGRPACSSSRRRSGSGRVPVGAEQGVDEREPAGRAGCGTTSPAASAASSDSSTSSSGAPWAAASRSASNSDPNVAARSSTARASSSSIASRRTARPEASRWPIGRHVGDEQRVAAGLGDDRLGLLRRRGRRAGRPRRGPRPCSGSRRTDGRAFEVGEQRGEVGVEVGLGVAGRDDDQQRRPVRPAGEVAHDVPRRRRRPVEVLDDEQQRRRGGARRRTTGGCASSTIDRSEASASADGRWPGGGRR